MTGSAQERFWSKVNKKTVEECWEWTGCILQSGYGQFRLDDKKVRAHRLAWELHYKQKIPEGMLILHHCDNPKCVNHNHLYCGTSANNAHDKTYRGRVNHIKNALSHATLSAKKILAIRSFKIHKYKNSIQYKYPQSIIARKFGINISTLQDIWNSNIHPCKEGFFVKLK